MSIFEGGKWVRFVEMGGRRERGPAYTELGEETPVVKVLAAEEKSEEGYVPVKFRSKITELGVFELWCVSEIGAGQWKLEFSVREGE
ncbi:MAG: hypothetical protein NTU53_16170 [Planctomycetota bacterium]|nr:hypothetical protein [Planctomycetota bacterium]